MHIAVMERHGIRSILSFDRDFDRWPGLQRIHRSERSDLLISWLARAANRIRQDSCLDMDSNQ